MIKAAPSFSTLSHSYSKGRGEDPHQNKLLKKLDISIGSKMYSDSFIKSIDKYNKARSKHEGVNVHDAWNDAVAFHGEIIDKLQTIGFFPTDNQSEEDIKESKHIHLKKMEECKVELEIVVQLVELIMSLYPTGGKGYKDCSSLIDRINQTIELLTIEIERLKQEANAFAEQFLDKSEKPKNPKVTFETKLDALEKSTVYSKTKLSQLMKLKYSDLVMKSNTNKAQLALSFWNLSTRICDLYAKNIGQKLLSAPCTSERQYTALNAALVKIDMAMVCVECAKELYSKQEYKEDCLRELNGYQEEALELKSKMTSYVAMQQHLLFSKSKSRALKPKSTAKRVSGEHAEPRSKKSHVFEKGNSKSTRPETKSEPMDEDPYYIPAFEKNNNSSLSETTNRHAVKPTKVIHGKKGDVKTKIQCEDQSKSVTTSRKRSAAGDLVSTTLPERSKTDSTELDTTTKKSKKEKINVGGIPIVQAQKTIIPEQIQPLCQSMDKLLIESNIQKEHVDQIYRLLGEAREIDLVVEGDSRPTVLLDYEDVLLKYADRLEDRSCEEYCKWLEMQKVVAMAIEDQISVEENTSLNKSDRESFKTWLQFDCGTDIIKNKDVIEKAFTLIKLAHMNLIVAKQIKVRNGQNNEEIEQNKEEIEQNNKEIEQRKISCEETIHKFRAFITETPEDAMALTPDHALIFDWEKEPLPEEKTHTLAAERERKEMRIVLAEESEANLPEFPQLEKSNAQIIKEYESERYETPTKKPMTAKYSILQDDSHFIEEDIKGGIDKAILAKCKAKKSRTKSNKLMAYRTPPMGAKSEAIAPPNIEHATELDDIPDWKYRPTITEEDRHRLKKLLRIWRRS